MTKVKICGITNLEDALLSVELGADALGFNFYEKSPRYIHPNRALQVVKELPIGVTTVGVFVNMQEDRISEFVGLLGLTAVQLHGDEDEEFVKALRLETDAQIIKAFRVGADFSPTLVTGYDLDTVLLDAYSSNQYGGTGESFSWSTAQEVKELSPELYLAGGLRPENVAEAVDVVHPDAVDVASGVELSPGIKDRKKVEAFIRNAKNA